MGETIFTDPLEIAGAYLFYLCRNHPFVDGNKRTALATCLVFLSEHGLLPHERLDADAWEALIIDVAASQIDREQTTDRLRTLIARSWKNSSDEQAFGGCHDKLKGLKGGEQSRESSSAVRRL